MSNILVIFIEIVGDSTTGILTLSQMAAADDLLNMLLLLCYNTTPTRSDIKSAKVHCLLYSNK